MRFIGIRMGIIRVGAWLFSHIDPLHLLPYHANPQVRAAKVLCRQPNPTYQGGVWMPEGESGLEGEVIWKRSE